MTTYRLDFTNSDLSGGADFSKKLLSSGYSTGTISVTTAASGTETSYAFTEPGEPGVQGTSTGSFTVEVTNTSFNGSIEVSVSLSRVNAAGSVQATSSTTAARALGSNATRTFSLTNPALGTWASGDRLRVNYIFYNKNTMSSISIDITAGNASNEVDTPWTITKSLTAAAGSYAITGTAATPKLGRKTVAAAGSYAITGTAATTKHGWKVVAAAGSYSITGTAATPKLGRRIIAGAGSYSITGTDATLTYTPTGSTYTLVAGAGSYAITGTAASPLLNRRTIAAVGSYSITGTAATPKLGRRVTAGAGSYAITGSTASVLHGYKIAALAGSYVINGTAASMRRGYRVTVEDSGSYVITGSTASLSYAQIVLEYISAGEERCMRCGFVRPHSQMRREWTGLLVCEQTCWDPRHPQMALRGVTDHQDLPWVRPEPEAVFVSPTATGADDL